MHTIISDVINVNVGIIYMVKGISVFLTYDTLLAVTTYKTLYTWLALDDLDRWYAMP